MPDTAIKVQKVDRTEPPVSVRSGHIHIHLTDRAADGLQQSQTRSNNRPYGTANLKSPDEVILQRVRKQDFS